MGIHRDWPTKGFEAVFIFPENFPSPFDRRDIRNVISEVATIEQACVGKLLWFGATTSGEVAFWTTSPEVEAAMRIVVSYSDYHGRMETETSLSEVRPETISSWPCHRPHRSKDILPVQKRPID